MRDKRRSLLNLMLLATVKQDYVYGILVYVELCDNEIDYDHLIKIPKAKKT